MTEVRLHLQRNIGSLDTAALIVLYGHCQVHNSAGETKQFQFSLISSGPPLEQESGEDPSHADPPSGALHLVIHRTRHGRRSGRGAAGPLSPGGRGQPSRRGQGAAGEPLPRPETRGGGLQGRGGRLEGRGVFDARPRMAELLFTGRLC